MKSIASLLVLALLATPAFAQTPYIETFEVRLHNLDVLVTDAKGHPVRGLTKADFLVTEDGQPQELTNFATFDAGMATAASDAASSSGELAVSAPPPRHVVFFIDEVAMSRVARNRLNDSVKKFVDNLRPGDLAAVILPAKKQKIALGFTSDRVALEAMLKAAIDESTLRYVGPALEVANLRNALNRSHNNGTRLAAKMDYAEAAARRIVHRLGQLRALTTSLAGIPGKKVVVMVTSGLTAKPGNEAFDFGASMGVIDPSDIAAMADATETRASRAADATQSAEDGSHPQVYDLTHVIQDLGRSAAVHGVTIYTLEPEIALDLNNRSDASIPSRERSDPRGEVFADRTKGLVRGFGTDALGNAQLTMDTLSDTTGGRWFRGIGDIDDTFRQISEDMSYSYSLAYRATGAEDQPHKVTVHVRNRPELHVRTRSEVMERSTGKEMGDLVIASLLYPRTVNELGINVSTGMPQKRSGLFTIPVDVILPLKNFTFLQNEAGKYVASFDLHYAAAGEQRDFGNGGRRQQHIELTPEQYKEAATTNYRFKTGIEVSPGQARIAIGVIDNVSKLTGFRTVEVLAR